MSWRLAGAVGAAALAAGCASMGGDGGQAKAPEPLKPVDMAQFYRGRWYEIARTPMNITNGCVAGTTDFNITPDGKAHDRDACRDKTPEGKEKVFAGPIDILNPGQNSKFKINYKIIGGLASFPVTFWVYDHADDYSWFMVTDPSFKNFGLFTRNPRPPQSEVDAFTSRAKSIGFTGDLEYPTQFPPGEGQPTEPPPT